MIKVAHNLFVGTVTDMQFLTAPNFRFVNTAHTHHCEIHAWKKAPPEHECYIFHEDEKLLSVNWIDGEARYFDYQGKGVANFQRILDYIDTQLAAGHIVVIVCNQAISRSPTVALVYLAKRLNIINNQTFNHAKENFMLVYPNYDPKGIADFVSANWENIV